MSIRPNFLTTRSTMRSTDDLRVMSVRTARAGARYRDDRLKASVRASSSLRAAVDTVQEVLQLAHVEVVSFLARLRRHRTPLARRRLVKSDALTEVIPDQLSFLTEDVTRACGRALDVVEVHLRREAAPELERDLRGILNVELEGAPPPRECDHALHVAEQPRSVVQLVAQRQNDAAAEVPPGAVARAVILPGVPYREVFTTLDTCRDQPTDPLLVEKRFHEA